MKSSIWPSFTKSPAPAPVQQVAITEGQELDDAGGGSSPAQSPDYRASLGENEGVSSAGVAGGENTNTVAPGLWTGLKQGFPIKWEGFGRSEKEAAHTSAQVSGDENTVKEGGDGAESGQAEKGSTEGFWGRQTATWRGDKLWLDVKQGLEGTFGVALKSPHAEVLNFLDETLGNSYDPSIQQARDAIICEDVKSIAELREQGSSIARIVAMGVPLPQARKIFAALEVSRGGDRRASDVSQRASDVNRRTSDVSNTQELDVSHPRGAQEPHRTLAEEELNDDAIITGRHVLPRRRSSHSLDE
eukprot:CAMPEP_0181334002 /NCGR_PEP_ID=MMETSP1101-20121128/26011_1 /TAXON_ID=46948 /ORGANISM="Rhodomonas abbreviata, Strain Caron Lab Isolate" /LENGTH=301 /DNA_ID=CAMNT_0023443917 /DNA_START=166 /DNA_END=1068 /DNA_ORIENTATION=-